MTIKELRAVIANLPDDYTIAPHAWGLKTWVSVYRADGSSYCSLGALEPFESPADRALRLRTRVDSTSGFAAFLDDIGGSAAADTTN